MNQFIKLRNQLIDCSSRKSGTCKEDNTYKCAVRIIQNYVNDDYEKFVDLKVQARCEISRGWTEKANEQLRIAVAQHFYFSFASMATR